MKRVALVVFAIAFLLVGCAPKITQEAYDAIVAERDELSTQLTELQTDYDSLKTERDGLQQQVTTLTQDKDTVTGERDVLQAKIDSSSEWFALTAEEQADMLVVLAERAAEREAQAALEAQQGYMTGITYSQLARTPDDYIGKKVMFKGRVLQVIEGTGTTTLRVATKGNYDDVLLVDYVSSIVSSRVLEDDIVTLYGVSNGLYTYESTGGGNITIPYVTADQIEISQK